MSRLSSSSPAHRPLFLHTGWRTSGTWLWSRFRVLPEIMGYYEPLHRVLARPVQEIAVQRSSEWASDHPDLEDPYFSEFLPLRRRFSLWKAPSGIQGYDEAFDVDSFAPLTRQHHPALERYLNRLLRHAHRQGRTAVLKFCRSMGRMRWMMTRFPQALHVALVRSPTDQFASMLTQLRQHDNPGFFQMGYETLATNQTVPRVARALAALDGHLLPPGLPLVDQMQAVRSRSPLELYRGFLALWLLQTMCITQDQPLIDCDRLGDSTSYTRDMEAQLIQWTGLARLDLSDAKPATLMLTPEGCQDLLGMEWEDLRTLHRSALQFAQDALAHDAQDHRALSIIQAKLQAVLSS